MSCASRASNNVGLRNVRFGSKADMTTSNPNVRGTPESGHRHSTGYHVRFVPIADIAPLPRRTQLDRTSRNHKAASRLPPLELLSQNRKSLRRGAYKSRILGGGKMAITAGSATSARVSSARASEATRWAQLVFGIVCMVMIANLQYGWTCLLIRSIRNITGAARHPVAFTIFVLAETWLVPFEGFVDRFGPKSGLRRRWSRLPGTSIRSPARSPALRRRRDRRVGAGVVYGTRSAMP